MTGLGVLTSWCFLSPHCTAQYSTHHTERSVSNLKQLIRPRSIKSSPHYQPQAPIFCLCMFVTWLLSLVIQFHESLMFVNALEACTSAYALLANQKSDDQVIHCFSFSWTAQCFCFFFLTVMFILYRITCIEKYLKLFFIYRHGEYIK